MIMVHLFRNFGRATLSRVVSLYNRCDKTLENGQYNPIRNDLRYTSSEAGNDGKLKCQKSGAEKKKFKKCCWVIFDLDGVVLDSEGLSLEAHKCYVAKQHKKYDMNLHAKVMSTSEREGAMTAIEELELKMSPEQYVHGVWQMKRDLYRKGVSLMPGAEALICRFSQCNIPIALVTSSTKKSFELKSRPHKKLFSRFCHIVLGDDMQLKHNKPAPDIFLLAASRFSNKPEEMDTVLVFEDSPNGVTAAKAAGMQVVMVPSPQLPKQYLDKADLVIRDLIAFQPEDFQLP